ncbi:MAG: cysteine protease StiP domain-containing protein [Verrucomicrobiota bacterium]
MEFNRGFSGSYAGSDVTFLLRRLELQPVVLEEREQRIQSGRNHYSEMIGPEDAPTRQRMRLFRESLACNGSRLARDLVTLASLLAESARGGELTIVSIARAGTPIGVLLVRLLRGRFGAERVRHYSISVIRDRGIDLHALDLIASRHGAESIRFVDGWTGKGTIANEIATSLAAEPRYNDRIDAGLWVPLDISGSARQAASQDDYLIPSSLLGGTISGLVSRSVLPRADVGSGQMHGCVELSHLRRYDLSRWFAGTMEALCRTQQPCPVAPGNAAARFARSQQFIDELMQEFSIGDRNRVKIGIGETVRVALRRLPERILLRDITSPDAVMIERLSRLRGVPVEHRADMPHAAVGLIANVVARP